MGEPHIVVFLFRERRGDLEGWDPQSPEPVGQADSSGLQSIKVLADS
jgi:hypothetical protein